MSSAEFVGAVRESSSPEQVLSVVTNRTKELEAGVEPIKFVAGGEKVTYKYIHPESAVKAYPFSKGFRVNDDLVHEQFARDVSEIAQLDIDPDEVVLEASMMATFRYFQQAGNERRRKKVHGGLFRGEIQDLATIKREGVAMCVEMTAVSHNLNMIGGVVSAFMLGKIKTEKGFKGHAWQIVKHMGENKVFDITRTVPEKRGDGFYSVYPFIGKVDALKLLTGNVVTIDPEIPEELAQSADYLFSGQFPTTFEGFAKLKHIEKAAISEMPKRELAARTVADIIINFNMSEFAQPVEPELDS